MEDPFAADVAASELDAYTMLPTGGPADDDDYDAVDSNGLEDFM